MQPNSVCLFFYVKGKFLLHGCSIDEAEEYYGGEAVLELDEHYQCRKCNKGYVV